ncbi:MAG: streptomycin 6-kinase [Acidimicrobiaceae bacterium]
MSRPLDLPYMVVTTARSYGAVGQRWLDGLGALVDELERDWDITIGATLSGGTASYVAEATTAEGESAVLKVAMPAQFTSLGDLGNEIRTLTIADGHGCARLLRHDEERRALLLERLGRKLDDLGLPVQRQLEIICATLPRLWDASPGNVELPSGAAKGRWLADDIARAWDELDQPCSSRVVDTALSFAERRIAAFDQERAVLVHGDAHGWNTLEEREGSSQFKFVDPDGLIAEREYDLAIPMREFNDELLAGDAVRVGQARCQLLSRLSNTDATRIWEWGFIERVSTALLLVREGHAKLAEDFLTVAEAWAADN